MAKLKTPPRMIEGTRLAATTEASTSALITFMIYLVFVFALAALANRAQKDRPFVSEYFLAGRNIGLWAFALTYGATAASGGSFMGFPALIYTHGWSLAWWICGFMVCPLVALGLFAKRINQVGRIAGAITVPELLRKRFASPAVGNTATLILVFFMFFYLLAQFKAGAQIMAVLLDGNEAFDRTAASIETLTEGWLWIGEAQGSYLICLILFTVSVVLYTAYGGFRAVVWTDVMQGLVMALGVLLMLVFAVVQVGGLKNASQEIGEMTPPEWATAVITIPGPNSSGLEIPKGTWVETTDGGMGRLKHLLRISKGESASEPVEFLVLTTASEITKTRELAEPGLVAELSEREAYAYGSSQPGVYLTPPGPSRTSQGGFLPVLLALSFFAFWNFSGAGQPSFMVRQMAFRDTRVLRRAMILVAVFFTVIYLPLVVIFTCARVLLPGWEIDPDRIMPEMAAALTENAGVPWLAGLLLAAPFAAIMSSVDSFLLLVSSGVVRDIYQQSINPEASEKTIKRLTHGVTIFLGVFGVIAVLNPPEFLQTLIVFASAGLGACFLVPMVLALYWPRMTHRGAVAGMITGGVTILVFYLIGFSIHGEFKEFAPWNIHPFIFAIGTTLVAVVVTSQMDQKPAPALVTTFFGKP